MLSAGNMLETKPGTAFFIQILVFNAATDLPMTLEYTGLLGKHSTGPLPAATPDYRCERRHPGARTYLAGLPPLPKEATRVSSSLKNSSTP